MKVSQLRKLLEAAAAQHERLAARQLGAGLRSLATAIKSADKLEVSKLVRKLSR